jgi:molecular chaperone GrpE (heat shock protein)
MQRVTAARFNALQQSNKFIKYNRQYFAAENEKEAADKKSDKQNIKEETSESPAKDEAPKKEEPKANKAEKAAKKNGEETTTSEEETPLISKEDLEKIKKLLEDQEKELTKLKEQLKQYKESYLYQRAENDNTVKRYKKEIDSTREFAISKFAKDLLEVRDNLSRSTEFIKKMKIGDEIDKEALKN